MVDVESILKTGSGELRMIPEGFSEKDRDGMIKFIYHFVDPNSEFRNMSNFESRKARALEAADIKKGNLSDEIFGEGEWFRIALFEYFKMVNDIDYELWFTLRKNFAFLMDKLRHDEQSVDVDKLVTNKNKIQLIEDELFNGSKEENLIMNEASKNPSFGIVERFAIDNPHS